MATKIELLAAVKEHAIEHYNDGKGWDYVIEAFSDADILEAIGKAQLTRTAIRNVNSKLLTGVRAGMESAACYDAF
jgi:hypothetical protein